MGIIILTRYSRPRCELFETLPKKSQLPDYFQVIQRPIALDMIHKRINSPYYTSKQQFIDDFHLMISNAQLYNMEGSEVYTDSIELKKVFDAAMGI